MSHNLDDMLRLLIAKRLAKSGVRSHSTPALTWHTAESHGVNLAQPERRRVSTHEIIAMAAAMDWLAREEF